MSKQEDTYTIKFQYKEKEVPIMRIEEAGDQENTSQNSLQLQGIQKKFKQNGLITKYYKFSQTMSDTIVKTNETKDVHNFSFRANTDEQFDEINIGLLQLENLKSLYANFTKEWYLDIVSPNFENSFAENFFPLVNLTHLSLKFENKIFQKTLGDMCDALNHFVDLRHLELKIPVLFNGIDQVNCDRIRAGINSLSRLEKYSIELGELVQSDLNLIFALSQTFYTHPNLADLSLDINTTITEELTSHLIDSITQAKSLLSLQLNIYKIVSRKALEKLFTPLFTLTPLQTFSLNIREKNINFIESMSKLTNLRCLKLGYHCKQVIHCEEKLMCMQLMPNLDELSLLFDDNVRLDYKEMNELGIGLHQLQITRLSIQFKSNNAIDSKSMTAFLHSLSYINQLEQFALTVGRHNYIGKHCVNALAECISRMPCLQSLQLAINESSCINLQSVQSLYHALLNLKHINYLNLDINNSNALLFINLINHFPNLLANSFILKHLHLHYNRDELSQSREVTSMDIDFSLFAYPNVYESTFLHNFNQLTTLNLQLNSNENINTDIAQSLRQLNQLTNLKLIIIQDIKDNEIRQLGKSFEGLKQLKYLKLQIIKGQFNTESYGCLSQGLSNLVNLEQLKFFIQTNQLNRNGELSFFNSLKSMISLQHLTLQLSSFDLIDDQAYFLDQAIKKMTNIQTVLIKNKLTLNESKAIKAAENVRYFKSVTLMKLMVNFDSCYELKIFLEKGVQYVANLRYLKITHNLEVDQKRLITQRSKIIRNIKRLVIFDI